MKDEEKAKIEVKFKLNQWVYVMISREIRHLMVHRIIVDKVGIKYALGERNDLNFIYEPEYNICSTLDDLKTWMCDRVDEYALSREK